jgi:hypothetical protein
MEEARNELAEMKMKETSLSPRAYDLQKIEAEIAKLNDALRTLKVVRVKYRDKTGEDADG